MMSSGQDFTISMLDKVSLRGPNFYKNLQQKVNKLNECSGQDFTISMLDHFYLRGPINFNNFSKNNTIKQLGPAGVAFIHQ